MKPYSAAALCSLLPGRVAVGCAGIVTRPSDGAPQAPALWRTALATPLPWLWTWRGNARAGRHGHFSRRGAHASA